MQSGLISTLILLPLFASVLILVLPESYKGSYKWISLITLILMFINLGTVLKGFDIKVPTYQYLEHFEWIRLTLGNTAILSIDYIVGVDGLSLSMLVLTILVFFYC